MAVSGTAFFTADHILNFLLQPAGERLSPFPDGKPVFTEPTGMFGVTVDLAWRSGVLVALPVFIIGLYKITPIFPRLPRKFLFLYVPSVVGLYVAGLAFVYFVMLPRGLNFLLNFGNDVAVPLISITDYFAMLKALLLWVPLIFQMPVLMWLLARAKVLTYRKVRKYRRIVLFGLAIFTAIITPTVDLVNFFVMYVPMLFLFESGLFLMWTVNPEQGDYLFIKRIRNAAANVLGKIRFVIGLPRRAIRKVLSIMRKLLFFLPLVLFVACSSAEPAPAATSVPVVESTYVVPTAVPPSTPSPPATATPGADLRATVTALEDSATATAREHAAEVASVEATATSLRSAVTVPLPTAAIIVEELTDEELAELLCFEYISGTGREFVQPEGIGIATEGLLWHEYACNRFLE